MHCERPNYMGRPLLHVGNRQLVCIDCFYFITGIDSRDPAVERTARSGDPAHLTLEEWCRLGKPTVPVTSAGGRTVSNVESGRPVAAPLPKDSPWWARVLHWLGVELVGQK